MSRRRRTGGFTTIELGIALVIIGVLAVVALPTFLEQVRKSRRTDGFTALSNLQQAQERWRSSNASYAGASLLTTTPGLGLDSTSGSGYYTVAITAADAFGYVASATAVSDSSQAADTLCTRLWVRMLEGNVSYGAGTTVNWENPDPNRCWVR